MSVVLTNKIRSGGFIESEANFARSRDEVVIEGGTGGAGQLYAGTVLGKITATGKYVECKSAAGDGSQTALAILYSDVDATAADVVAAVVSRDAEVRQADLTYDSSLTVNTANTQLAAAGIIVRVSNDTQST